MSRFYRFVTVLIIAISTLTAWSPVVADEASEALSKYREPVDVAVDKALKFLSEVQKDDGSFPGQYGDTTAVPSLAGMAFLSKGYTPGFGPYGQNINRSMDYVFKNEQQSGGKATGYLVRTGTGKMYAHCISTLFLSEVSGMVDPARQEKIDAALPRALSKIITAQEMKKSKPEYKGGWRYQPSSTDADLSLTGWAVMALRSGALNGAPIPDTAVKDAVDFILNCRPRNTQGEKGFSYQPFQGGKPAMTGVGILCLALCGQHDNKMLPRAGEYLLASGVNKKWGGSHFYYTNYYCTQAMFQLGGDYWDRWAEEMYENALSHQAADGSWGSAYSTAMTILSLTVSYRQLPVYQR